MIKISEIKNNLTAGTYDRRISFLLRLLTYIYKTTIVLSILFLVTTLLINEPVKLNEAEGITYYIIAMAAVFFIMYAAFPAAILILTLKILFNKLNISRFDLKPLLKLLGLTTLVVIACIGSTMLIIASKISY